MSQQALAQCGLYVIYRNFRLVENLVTLGGVSHVDFCQHLAPAVAHTCLHKDNYKDLDSNSAFDVDIDYISIMLPRGLTQKVMMTMLNRDTTYRRACKICIKAHISTEHCPHKLL
jgi:hypothetical protein